MDGSKEVPTTELITTKAVEKANIFVIGWRSVANFFTNLLIKNKLPVFGVAGKTGDH